MQLTSVWTTFRSCWNCCRSSSDDKHISSRNCTRSFTFLNLPSSTIRKVLRSVLNVFPLRFQRIQFLEAEDSQLRLDLFNKFLISYDEDSSWPLRNLSTDEARFTLSGKMNSKSCTHWADNNPHNVFASPLHDEKVTVYCGITSTFILSLYFF